MASSDLKRLGPFPMGMDNRAPDSKLRLPEGAGHLLRDALNVDVTEQGTVKTRTGYERVVPGGDCHSLWAPVGGAFALYCDTGSVYRLGVSSIGVVDRTMVATGFGYSAPVRYAQVNEAIYFTDGIRAASYHPRSGPTPAWLSAMTDVVNEQVLAPMPAGQCIAYHAGRLLVAVGSVLVYSEPFSPNVRDVAAGYEMFPAPITCIAAVEGGVFVMADQTYFIPDGFPAKEVRAVLAYGAPEQQAGYRQDGGAHWMGTEGVVSCSKRGELQNLQEEHIALSVTGAAATLWREADGQQSIVAALMSPSSVGAGVGSFAQARIVRKE
jgi:hypothetical protein